MTGSDWQWLAVTGSEWQWMAVNCVVVYDFLILLDTCTAVECSVGVAVAAAGVAGGVSAAAALWSVLSQQIGEHPASLLPMCLYRLYVFL